MLLNKKEVPRRLVDVGVLTRKESVALPQMAVSVSRLLFGAETNRSSELPSAEKSAHTSIYVRSTWTNKKICIHPVQLRNLDIVTSLLKAASTFIQNFADNHALILSGRMINYKNSHLKLLPSSMTKKCVWMTVIHLSVCSFGT